MLTYGVGVEKDARLAAACYTAVCPNSRRKPSQEDPKGFAMRRFAFAFLLIVSAAMQHAASQAPEFITPEYLAPQYAAPPNAPFSIVVAESDEPGDRLIVTGRTLDGTTPVAGVSIYVFHTDAKGQYARDISGPQAELSPRLHGALRTDEQGRYRYDTVRPAGYDSGAAHVHYVVKANGYKPRLLELRFEDDPFL
jgi:protocatechuate 3,4-dioxygenase beta subunit